MAWRGRWLVAVGETPGGGRGSAWPLPFAVCRPGEAGGHGWDMWASQSRQTTRGLRSNIAMRSVQRCGYNERCMDRFRTDSCESVKSQLSPLGHTAHRNDRFFLSSLPKRSADCKQLGRLGFSRAFSLP